MTNKSYLGKWVQEDSNGDFKQIEIIDVNGTTCFMKGSQNQTIGTGELDISWQPLSAIVDDPYASTDLGAIVQQAQAEGIVIDEPTVKEQVIDTSEPVTDVFEPIPPQQNTPPKMVEVEEFLDPSEKALDAVISASTATNVVEFTVRAVIPIDITKLAIIANALDIPHEVAAKVLASKTKTDSATIQNTLIEAISEQLSELKV